MTNERSLYDRLIYPSSESELSAARNAAWSEIERLRAALNLVLTFYGAPYWTPDLRSDWKEATGSDEATTKVLCDFIRRTLNGERAQYEPTALPMDAIAAICHEVSGTCVHALKDARGACTIENCSAVRGYLGSPQKSSERPLSVQRAIGACKHDFGPSPDPDGTRCLKGCGAVYQL